ncbi:MAG: glycosyltransferase family 9 protein, partial [Planctomycetes bacterium]|nr:glycosyltransferase family 9 protein [Planctomycetota bacterium]
MTERVLFIRLSALGDVVMTLPALLALRAARPDAAVDWVVEDRCAGILRLVEGIDRLIVFPRQALARPGIGAIRALGAHLTELRRESYAAAIDFQGNLKGALHLLRARAARRIGPDARSSREGAHWFTSVRVPLPAACHRVERALTLVRPLGVAEGAFLQGGVLSPALRPRFAVDSAADAEVEERLAASPGAQGPLVVLHPGSSAFGSFKR